MRWVRLFLDEINRVMFVSYYIRLLNCTGHTALLQYSQQRLVVQPLLSGSLLGRLWCSNFNFSNKYSFQGYAWPFYQPVDADLLGLEDYHEIITKPMDLGTVKVRFRTTYCWLRSIILGWNSQKNQVWLTEVHYFSLKKIFLKFSLFLSHYSLLFLSFSA